MKRTLLAGIAVLSVLHASAAQATERCAVVRKTSDGFLALREAQGPQSRMKGKLFEGNHLRIDDEGWGDEAPYYCVNPMIREYGMNDNMRKCRSLWVRVTACCIDADLITGWVNSKYIRQFECKDPEYIGDQK